MLSLETWGCMTATNLVEKAAWGRYTFVITRETWRSRGWSNPPLFRSSNRSQGLLGRDLDVCCRSSSCVISRWTLRIRTNSQVHMLICLATVSHSYGDVWISTIVVLLSGCPLWYRGVWIVNGFVYGSRWQIISCFSCLRRLYTHDTLRSLLILC